jgi:hypothetical protein
MRAKYLRQIRAHHVAAILQAVCVTLRAIAVELFSPLHQVALAPVFFDQLGDAVAALTVALGALMSPKMR